MSRLLSVDEKDAVCTLLSVRSSCKRLLDSGDSESSDSYSQSGSSSQCKDISKSTESDPDGRASKETFQFQHIIEFDPDNMDRTMRKPVIKKKMVCECGAIILTRTEWKHKQTNKHIQFILRKRAHQEQQQVPLGVQRQEHTPLSVQQQHKQQPPQEHQNRYLESPPPVSENLGALTDLLPAKPQLQPPSQQQLPQASLWSNDGTGSLFLPKMYDTQPQIVQHSDLAVPSIFTEVHSSRNLQLPEWNGFGPSGYIMDLGQQSFFRTSSSQMPYTVEIRQRGLAPHHLWIDQPDVHGSVGGWHHAFQPRTPLGDRIRISDLGQQQPQWYVAAPPLHERQCYRIPMTPETRFFDSDYSASLSNFPIDSFF